MTPHQFLPLLAAATLVAACSVTDPAGPPTLDQEAGVAADSAVGRLELCKVGATASFNVFVDTNPPTPVTLGDGGCAVVHTYTGGPRDSVTILELTADSFQLDSIVLDSITPDTTFRLPALTNTPAVSVFIDSLIGYRATFFNSPIAPPDTGRGRFEVCKVGAAATFEAFVNDSGPQALNLGDGDCAIVHSTDTGPDSVTVIELVTAGLQLDSIVLDSMLGDSSVRLPPITDTNTVFGRVDSLLSYRATFYNTALPPPDTGLGRVELCKVGATASFNVFVDTNPPTPVTLGNGGCAVVHTYTGGPRDSVTVDELMPNSFPLDSIVLDSITVGGSFHLPPITSTSTVSVFVDSLLGYRITYFNRPAPPPPPPDTLGAEVEVCKVGAAAAFRLSVNDSGPQGLVLGDGDCAVVHRNEGGPADFVMVREFALDVQLDSIVLDSIVMDSTLIVRSITGTDSVSRLVGDGTGYRLTFYNTVLVSPGGEGCTPGYWKQPHHFDSWNIFRPDDLFADLGFDNAFPGSTLLDVLRQGGGRFRALGRHVVAALLNGASPAVDYDLTIADVILSFNDAFADGDVDGTKDLLEGFNELGCPLN